MPYELTQLPDRASFFQALEKCVAKARREPSVIGLVLVQVRKLREINSELGYHAGDLILSEFAARIAGCLRPSDVMARISGSEFALILPSLIGSGQAVLAANKISEISTESFDIDGQTIRLRVAVGAAVYPDHAQHSMHLMNCAESALAVAKTLTESHAVYSDEQNRPTTSVLSLETELEAAIESGEIEAYYQPKIDLRTRQIAGVETLARWVSPSQGPVRPDFFIAIAEQSGLILPLTLLILNVALRELRDVQETFDLSVAVNLSATILNDHEVDTLVNRALSIWGTATDQLILEVTESAMMADPTASLRTLSRLNSTGVKISIDDFGTGYSSLAYLKSLPVNELKIDKSFVMNMVGNEGDAKIVKSVVDLAQNFDLTVVAEGIENQETFDRLATMGCEYAQGFYMGHPMPIDDLVTWIEESPWGRRSSQHRTSRSRQHGS